MSLLDDLAKKEPSTVEIYIRLTIEETEYEAWKREQIDNPFVWGFEELDENTIEFEFYSDDEDEEETH